MKLLRILILLILATALALLPLALGGCVSLGFSIPTKHGTTTVGVSWAPKELPPTRGLEK